MDALEDLTRRRDAGNDLASGELLVTRLAGEVDGENRFPCGKADGDKRAGVEGILGEVANITFGPLDLDTSERES